MELVVINGSHEDSCETAANRLRAHGYHYFSPKLFFVDDFGDLHFDPSRQDEANKWCQHHADQEIAHHHDVVLQGVYLNEELMQKAESEGYHVVVLRCDDGLEQQGEKQIRALVAAHEQAHPSLFKRLFG
ncbi:MAG: hypothetical protein R3227_04710 [Reinekea sp.]|nr:hypothetical protein [Reinekea sp.]